MNNGFKKPTITLYTDEVNKLIKKYKKVKKYMKSSLYQMKTLDGSETLVSGLINEAYQDPPDL